jgi:hypothetical protein
MVLQTVTDKYTFASDSEFAFINDALAPNTYNGVQGYYKYIGNKQYVEIPEKINGNTMLDYYRMFSGNESIKGVSSSNKQITSMEEMFSYSKIEEVDKLDTSNTNSMKRINQSRRVRYR